MKLITNGNCSIMLSLLLVFVSCSSEPVYGSRFDEISVLERPQEDENLNTVPDSWVEAAAITEDMALKAQAYRNATHYGQELRNGVYVYSATAEKYAASPEVLAARIAVLGFRDVYLSVKKSMIKAVDTWLRTFIATCADYGVRVYATRIADVMMLADTELVKEDVALIKTYNSAVRTKERFAGIAADLEPHIAKEDSHPGSVLPYTWNADTGYGVGKDNDMLLKRTLQALEVASKELRPSLYLNEAVAVAFQSNHDDGRLSYGSMPQFLEYCDNIVVMAYFDDKDDIWIKSLPSLSAAQKEKSVSIAVKTAMNEFSPDSLQPFGWDNLIETLEYLKNKGVEVDEDGALRHPAFRGLDMFTYEDLEEMWE